jgi:hypothetical protein
MTRSFNLSDKPPLVLCRRAGDAPRKNLAVVRYEPLENLRVLIVYRKVLRLDLVHFLPKVDPTARPASAVATAITASVAAPVTTAVTTAIAAPVTTAIAAPVTASVAAPVTGSTVSGTIAAALFPRLSPRRLAARRAALVLARLLFFASCFVRHNHLPL